MIYAIIGFLLGMSVGISDKQSRVQRKLAAFLDSRGIRLIGSDGNEVPQADLAAELKKR